MTGNVIWHNTNYCVGSVSICFCFLILDVITTPHRKVSWNRSNCMRLCSGRKTKSFKWLLKDWKMVWRSSEALRHRFGFFFCIVLYISHAKKGVYFIKVKHIMISSRISMCTSFSEPLAIIFSAQIVFMIDSRLGVKIWNVCYILLHFGRG